MENNLFRPILVKLLFFVNRFVLDQYLIFLALMIYSSKHGTAWAPDLLPSVIELIQYRTYPVRHYLPVQMFCLIGYCHACTTPSRRQHILLTVFGSFKIEMTAGLSEHHSSLAKLLKLVTINACIKLHIRPRPPFVVNSL